MSGYDPEKMTVAEYWSRKNSDLLIEEMKKGLENGGTLQRQDTSSVMGGWSDVEGVPSDFWKYPQYFRIKPKD